MQISRRLSGKLYKWRRKLGQGDLSQKKSPEVAHRLWQALIKPGCETQCQWDKSKWTKGNKENVSGTETGIEK